MKVDPPRYLEMKQKTAEFSKDLNNLLDSLAHLFKGNIQNSEYDSLKKDFEKKWNPN